MPMVRLIPDRSPDWRKRLNAPPVFGVSAGILERDSLGAFI
jgi:hypothetical protein